VVEIGERGEIAWCSDVLLELIIRGVGGVDRTLPITVIGFHGRGESTQDVGVGGQISCAKGTRALSADCLIVLSGTRRAQGGGVRLQRGSMSDTMASVLMGSGVVAAD